MAGKREILLTPWRMDYIMNRKDQGCVFCQKAVDGNDAEDGVLLRRERAFVLMNIFPYNNGHIMIAPRRHEGRFAGLDPEELREVAELIPVCEAVLHEAMKAQGVNIGVNIGEASGAGFADHLHVHLVPRWKGDTNFMGLMSDIRLLPETLQQTYERLKPYFDRMG